jgi:hypothetical protein
MMVFTLFRARPSVLENTHGRRVSRTFADEIASKITRRDGLEFLGACRFFVTRRRPKALINPLPPRLYEIFSSFNNIRKFQENSEAPARCHNKIV